MLNGDFSGLITYAQAHSSELLFGIQRTRVGTDHRLRLVERPVYNRKWGSQPADRRRRRAWDPVAAQFTNSGLPGHSAAATGTAAPTSTAQNLAGQMFYASRHPG